MPRNSLKDLNNHLFEQLERLNDEDLKGEDLSRELEKAKAIASIAQQIINTGNLVLKAEQFKSETLGKSEAKFPKMLEGNE